MPTKVTKSQAATAALLTLVPRKWRKRVAAIIVLLSLIGTSGMVAAWKASQAWVRDSLREAMRPVLAQMMDPYTNRVEQVDAEGSRRESRIIGYCEAVVASRSNSQDRVYSRINGLDQRVDALEKAREP